MVDTSYLGNTTIKESLSILEKSMIVIGADTGMMHCADALGKRTISLFGGTPAEVWHPYSEKNQVIVGKTNCAPCYGKDYAIDCKERKCMESITVENVIAKIN
jgi:heptosyltransferase-2